MALLHNPAFELHAPDPGRSHATATVCGRHSRVKQLSNATRTCSSLTWHSNVHTITRTQSLEALHFGLPLSAPTLDILCEQHERTVNNDNCVSFEGLSFQIPADEFRYHYVRTRVRVHRYLDATLAVFMSHAN